MNWISTVIGIIGEMLKAWNQWQLISLGEAKQKLKNKEESDALVNDIRKKQNALDAAAVDSLLIKPADRGNNGK